MGGPVLRRFLVPPIVTTLVCWIRYGAKVSHRAEVELNSNLKLGAGVVIGSFTKLKCASGVLELGQNVDIANSCFIAAHEGGIRIGRDTLIGPSVSILSANLEIGDIDVPIRLQGHSSRGVTIGENVWIGAGCAVLDGADIGSGCVISANAVVSGRIPPNSVVAGNPAKVVFTRRS
jgi:acetyltransferase-like isoleucine patch superfamily enzyme